MSHGGDLVTWYIIILFDVSALLTYSQLLLLVMTTASRALGEGT